MVCGCFQGAQENDSYCTRRHCYEDKDSRGASRATRKETISLPDNWSTKYGPVASAGYKAAHIDLVIVKGWEQHKRTIMSQSCVAELSLHNECSII